MRSFSFFLLCILVTTATNSFASGLAVGDFMATPVWGSSHEKATKAPSIDENNSIIKELNKWAAGTVVFNPQPQMTLNEWHSFEIIVSPDKYSPGLLERLIMSLRRPTFIQYTSVKHVTRKMLLQLTGENPDDFSIYPKRSGSSEYSPRRQTTVLCYAAKRWRSQSIFKINTYCIR